MSDREIADSLLAEFVNLAENDGYASIVDTSGQVNPLSMPSILLAMMAESNKAELLVRALLDVADTATDVQGRIVPELSRPAPSLQYRDSGIFVEE